MANSFWDELTGTAAWDELTGAAAINRGADAQRQGVQEGRGYTQTAYDTARGYQEPYATGGQADYQNLRGMVSGGQFNVNPQAYSYGVQQPGAYQQTEQQPGQYQQGVEPGQYQQTEQQPGFFDSPDAINAGQQPGAFVDKGFQYEADPGAAFRMEQGTSAINTNAAAQGSGLSGATLKALAKYGSGLASQEYGDAYNRYAQNRQFGAGEAQNAIGNWQNQRNFLQSQLQNQQQFGLQNVGQRLGQFNQNRAFGADQAQNAINQFNQNRQFGFGANQAALGQFNQNRAFNYGMNQDALGQYNQNRAFDYGAASDLYNRQATEANQRYGRYSDLAGMGRGAANNMSNLASAYGANMAGLSADAGNITANQNIGRYNAAKGLVNDVVDTATTIYGINKGAKK